MIATLIVVGALVVLFTLLNMKTSRSDGTYLGNIHPFRKLMLYIMPNRNESVVYYDDYAKVDELERYVKTVGPRVHADITHCIVAAVVSGMKKAPTMNRFVVGRRLYQRKGLWITFSMKRKKLDKKAKLSAVKRLIPSDQSFFELVSALNENIKVERSDAKTYQDKELGLLSKIPRPVLRIGVKFLYWLDYYGLLPADFIKNDAMYTSIFAANLGSLGMNPGFHHLYEWGTCPLFLMIGKAEERVFVEDGQVVVHKVLPLRFTFDERIDDGLNAGIGIKGVVDALEHPFELLGCVATDGSDDHPIGDPPPSKPIPSGCLGAPDTVIKNAAAHTSAS
ncbi:MAG: hypothetical protein CVU56_21190 [Deltaproteobacteria bacterium HGW-Deltaproteobacteria-14]|jgi:hypothetical protein|nr:MAG: hypothetical protein CVU56_21190 [Deltaproteobacteria bacterium HGW-Deltaproteobacteria-14]